MFELLKSGGLGEARTLNQPRQVGAARASVNRVRSDATQSVFVELLKSGGLGEARTLNQRLKRPLLYH